MCHASNNPLEFGFNSSMKSNTVFGKCKFDVIGVNLGVLSYKKGLIIAVSPPLF